MSDGDSSDNLHEPPSDPAARLEHIVDETEERAECTGWIHRQFVDGRDADTILAEVIGFGWPDEDAEAMVEEGRRDTRHLRGVVTRDEVSQSAEAGYRRTKRRLAVIVSVTLVGAVVIVFIYLGYFQKK